MITHTTTRAFPVKKSQYAYANSHVAKDRGGTCGTWNGSPTRRALCGHTSDTDVQDANDRRWPTSGNVAAVGGTVNESDPKWESRNRRVEAALMLPGHQRPAHTQACSNTPRFEHTRSMIPNLSYRDDHADRKIAEKIEVHGTPARNCFASYPPVNRRRRLAGRAPTLEAT
jgi:hypothetical protein